MLTELKLQMLLMFGLTNRKPRRWSGGWRWRYRSKKPTNTITKAHHKTDIMWQQSQPIMSSLLPDLCDLWLQTLKRSRSIVMWPFALIWRWKNFMMWRSDWERKSPPTSDHMTCAVPVFFHITFYFLEENLDKFSSWWRSLRRKFGQENSSKPFQPRRRKMYDRK